MCGRKTCLFCAWLAWSRFRVVVPILDRTFGTLVACLDGTLHRLGGVPTYLPADNEKTVTVEHVAGVPIRHPAMVAVGCHHTTTSRRLDVSASSTWSLTPRLRARPAARSSRSGTSEDRSLLP